jgi:hypothetical protein
MEELSGGLREATQAVPIHKDRNGRGARVPRAYHPGSREN